MSNDKYQFELKFKVRGYECDLQGIVNNLVCQNYLEHTRHEFMLSIGLDYADLFKRNIAAMVARVDIKYKQPLKSGDEFISKLYVVHEGIKYLFYQNIYRASDNKLCIKGVITTVTVINGQLAVSDEIVNAIKNNK